MELEAMLTVDQVAEHLQVKISTVRHWLVTGKMRGTKPGGDKMGWRVRASEVDRFVDQRPA